MTARLARSECFESLRRLRLPARHRQHVGGESPLVGVLDDGPGGSEGLDGVDAAVGGGVVEGRGPRVVLVVDVCSPGDQVVEDVVAVLLR